ncbi:unnamed protein product [Acidithrix sp. C25]|nr:unnamed protein product [Acidithrix sp. C25]
MLWLFGQSVTPSSVTSAISPSFTSDDGVVEVFFSPPPTTALASGPNTVGFVMVLQ